MCLSIYLALVIGFYLLLMNVAMIIDQQRFKKISNEFLTNPPLLTLSGAMGIAVGLIIVIAHNIWEMEWVLLITLIGWFTLIQGVVRVYRPHYFSKIVKEINGSVGYKLTSYLWLLIGIFLIWSGFANGQQ